MKRIALALLALLALQGLVSLTVQRSLLVEVAVRSRRLLDAAASGARARLELDSAEEQGPYALHADARVGYVMRASEELTLDEVAVHSDDLGLRARPGASAAPEALRVVVLGADAVFGRGLADEDTLAVQLEALLSRALPATASGAAVECRTLAMPGWNLRNAIAFLQDHLDVLDPKLVVLVADAGALYDTEFLNELGERCWLPDPASADRWLPLLRTRDDAFAHEVGTTPPPRDELPAAGTPVLLADLTRESQRRYDENAAQLVQLARQLKERGARLLVAHYEDDPYALTLGLRLAALCRADKQLELPQLGLFSNVPRELATAPESNPGAQACGAMAHWIAAECLQRGWVPGPTREVAESLSASLLAEVPPAIASWRAASRSEPEQLAAAAEARARMSAELRAEIDVPTRAGAAQILGGVQADGSVGTHALFVLARGGSQLLVSLEPLSGRPDLYPQRVSVEVDGEPVGKVLVTAESPAERIMQLPVTAAGPTIEVRLIPERSVVVPDAGGERLAAFRLQRLACIAE